MSGLRFDLTRAKRFISDEELSNFREQVLSAEKTLLTGSGAGNDFLGWLDLPLNYDREEFSRIERAAEKIRGDSELLLVIGIGGSYLGARAANEFLNPCFYNELPREKRGGPEIYYCGNNLSSKYLCGRREVLRPHRGGTSPDRLFRGGHRGAHARSRRDAGALPRGSL